MGENTLFTIKEIGGIRLQKRLSEYPLSCVHCYRLPPEKPDVPPLDNVLIGTFSGHLLVLREMQLVWCARLQGLVPLQVITAEFAGIKGMIVSLDERGKLQVSYLGTDPPVTTLLNTETKELNYEEMEKEHQNLLRIIRQTHGEGAREAEEQLRIRAQVPATLDSNPDDDPDMDDAFAREDGLAMQCTVRLIISLQGSKTVENVTIALKSPACFVPSQTSICIDRVVPGGTPQVVPVVFRILSNTLCSGLDITACASYFSANNEPRTLVTQFRLPFLLAAKVIQPVKTAAYKIQFDCNRQIPPLQIIFQDFLAPFSQVIANILSVQYISGAQATVNVSKHSNRFSVQASEFAALWVLTQELQLRLNRQFDGHDGREPFSISFQDSLPLHDYFGLVDDHFELRKHLVELRGELANRTQQYRVIQKRLLLRFKDRNPAPLNHLDTLLNMTFEHTVELADSIDDAERALRTVSCHLSAATELILLLMRFRFDLDDENFSTLRLHLSPEVSGTPEQGWEEQVDASLIHLLRTSLARNAKDRSVLPAPMKVPADTIKLKKRITSVVERLASGSRITTDKQPPPGSPSSRVAEEEDAESDT